MKRLAFVAAVFAALTCSTYAVAQEVDVPPVETWEKVTIPNEPPSDIQAKFPVGWYSDPRGEDYEGSTISIRNTMGNETIVAKCWNFRKADFSEVRCALLMKDGTWTVGDSGEMLSLDFEKNEAGDITATSLHFIDAHDAHKRRFESK